MGIYNFFFQFNTTLSWNEFSQIVFEDTKFKYKYLFEFRPAYSSSYSTTLKYVDEHPHISKFTTFNFKVSPIDEIFIDLWHIYAMSDIYFIGYYGCIKEGGFAVSDKTDIVVDVPQADWIMFNDVRRMVPIKLVEYQKRYFYNFYYILQDVWLEEGEEGLPGTYENKILQLSESTWIKYLFWYSVFYLNQEPITVVNNSYWRFALPHRFKYLNVFSILDCLGFLWANANVFNCFKFLKRRNQLSLEYYQGRFRFSPEFSKGLRPFASLSSYSARFRLTTEAAVYYEYCRMFWWWKYEEPLVYVQYFPENYAFWRMSNLSNFLNFRWKLKERYGFRSGPVEDLRTYAEMVHAEETQRQWDAKTEEFRRNVRGEVLKFEDLFPKVDYNEIIGCTIGVWRFGFKNIVQWYLSVNEIPYWSSQTEYARVSGFNPEVRLYLQRSFVDIINQRVWRYNGEMFLNEISNCYNLRVSNLNLLCTRVAFHLP